jgi:hypothetical protein
MPQHPNVIILQQLLQASVKIVASEGGNASSLFFGWMGLSGGWGPLSKPGARIHCNRILINPLAGTLLGHTRHDGPQQRELVPYPPREL